jgi:uncharacterized phage protein (TIGR02218 family)
MVAMKTITTAFKNHLAGEVTNLANCWRLVRRDGRSFFFTDHDQDLTISGNTYLSAIGYEQTAINADSTLKIDNLEVTGILDSDTLVSDDLRSGLFDFAEVFLFAVNWSDLTQGVMRLRRGTLGEISTTPAGTFQGELRGMAQRFSQKVGEVFTPECRADLGDNQCKVDLGPLTKIESVATLGDSVIFGVTNAAGAADGWYNLGALTWLTGANTGRSMEVKEYSTVADPVLRLYLPMPRPVLVGDQFRVYPGCDKRHDTCRDKFNNILNRRAEDFIPGFDAIIQTPNAHVS